MMTGEKIQIDDYNLYYEKHGNGNKIVVMLPGAMGELIIITEFKLNLN